MMNLRVRSQRSIVIQYSEFNLQNFLLSSSVSPCLRGEVRSSYSLPVRANSKFTGTVTFFPVTDTNVI